MASLESPRFPEDISYGVTFGPEFVTEVASLPNGTEARDRMRTRALCVGECAHGVKTMEELKVLHKFFRSMGGRFHTFRFKDWTDFVCLDEDGSVIVVDANNIPTGASSGTRFQLCKDYEAAIGFSEKRYIKKPIATGFVLKESGVTLTGGAYTLDATTGIIVTSGSKTVASLSWSGQFDVHCRFDTDRMAVSLEDLDAHTWGQIPIKEVLE